MRHVRRFIAALFGLAILCVAGATAAFAQFAPDPAGGGGSPAPLPTPVVSGAQFWQFLLVAAIAALLTIAVVGLIASVRQTRAAQPSGMLHA